MNTTAMGTTKQGDQIDAEVWHDPRASYSRSVMPAAKRNVVRLGLFTGWAGYEATVVDTDRVSSDGRAVTIVRYVRTR